LSEFARSSDANGLKVKAQFREQTSTTKGRDMNDDLTKYEIEAQFHAATSRPSFMRQLMTPLNRDQAGAMISNAAALGARVAHTPTFEPGRFARARNAWNASALVALLALGAIGADILLEPTGLSGLLLRLVAAAGGVLAGFLAVLGHRLHSDPGIPAYVTASFVDTSRDMLAANSELGRPSETVARDLVVWALLTADAGFILYLILPTLLPDVDPTITLLFVCAGALVVGKLLCAGVEFFARGFALGGKRTQHAMLAASAAADKQRAAQRLRQTYGAVEGGLWPVGSGLLHLVHCYRGALGWALALGVFLAGLLALRALTGGDILSMVLVGGLALAAIVVSAAAAIRAISLTSDIRLARRVVDRWGSGAGFEAAMFNARNTAQLRMLTMLTWLRTALAPTYQTQETTDFDVIGPFERELAALEKRQTNHSSPLRQVQQLELGFEVPQDQIISTANGTSWTTTH
jgi:hypothetical protein